MTNLLVLVGCFSIGVLARRYSGLPADSQRVVNLWVMWVSLPALVLKAVHGVALEPALFLGAAVLLLEFVVALGLGMWAMRTHRLPREVAGALVLCLGLGNTAFLGFPLIELLGGKEAVDKAIVVDQLGSFVALAVLAVPFAVALGGGKATPGLVVKRVVTFPPFVALVLALVTRPVAFPAPMEAALGRLADMLTPLALASIGWVLNFQALKGQGRTIALALGYRMVLVPAVALLVLWLVRPVDVSTQVIIAEVAMPPMVTSGVLASENGLMPELAAGLIAVGVLVAMLTVPAWWWLTGLLA